MLQCGNKQFTQAALPIHMHLSATNHSQEQAALGVCSCSSWYPALFTSEVSVVYSVASSKWDALAASLLL